MSGKLIAQNISGYWEGKIAISKKDSLTLGIQVEYRADTLYIELDSPDQYFTGQPASNVQFEDSVLSFSVPEFGLSFEGQLATDGRRLTGTCKQHGRKFPCELATGAQRKQFLRPQTPKPPYPYRTEEINFRDRDGKYFLINGTLTLPESTPKGVVIFISGSGWQDRDETISGHKPFAVLADTITKAGFATYRYDDFPVTIFRKSTTFDFAEGLRLVIDSLLERDDLRGLNVFLLGHSEGSLVASIVASDDQRVSGTIHLAGVAQPFEEILLYQSEALLRASNTVTEKEIENSMAINRQIYSIIKKSKDPKDCMERIGKLWDELSRKLSEEEREKYNMTPDKKLATLQTFSSPWYYTLFRIDPVKYLKKIKSPVLAISGDKDLQVEATRTEENMLNYLKKCQALSFERMVGLNHLLQPCITGNLDEYGQIETTIDPEVLGIAVKWLDRISYQTIKQ
jgi:hypothetical protein